MTLTVAVDSDGSKQIRLRFANFRRESRWRGWVRDDLVMRRLLGLLTLPALVAGAASCSPASNEGGDCNARIEYQGVTYRPHN